jgi:hypothetical protein
MVDRAFWTDERVTSALDDIIKELGGIPEYKPTRFWRMLAERLATSIGREKPYDWRYPYQVYRRDLKPSDDFILAVQGLLAALDGARPDVAAYERVWIVAKRGTIEPGSEVLATSRRCAWCGKPFVPAYDSEKTHPGDCREEYRRKLAKIRYRRRKQ